MPDISEVALEVAHVDWIEANLRKYIPMSTIAV